MEVLNSNGVWTFVSGCGIVVAALSVDALLARVSSIYRWATPWHKQKMTEAFNKALEGKNN